jgi:hypothetical protein
LNMWYDLEKKTRQADMEAEYMHLRALWIRHFMKEGFYHWDQVCLENNVCMFLFLRMDTVIRWNDDVKAEEDAEAQAKADATAAASASNGKNVTRDDMDTDDRISCSVRIKPPQPSKISTRRKR